MMIMINMIMTMSRMNHACLKIGNSIFVAGGVTADNFNQRLVTKKVERLENTNTNENESLDVILEVIPFRKKS